MEEEHVLTIENLQSYFFTAKGIAPAVDDVTTEVPAGETIGLMGEPGRGRSITAASVMEPLHHPGKVAGDRILLDRRDITHLGPKERAGARGDEISMIFQEPTTSLNPVYQMGRQVQKAILLHQKVSREKAERQVIEIFREVGIPEPEKRYNSYPYQFSSDLRQRVMIGMAMVCRPKIMIVDGPTTALDATIEIQILRLMKYLRDEQGASIALITHSMGAITKVCGYMYVIYTGKVMGQTEAPDLFASTKHSYTQGLLRSIPKLNSNEECLYTIESVVPNILHLPRGCNFCDRCTRVAVRCLEEEPQLYDTGTDKSGMGHRVRCFLYDDRSVEGSQEAEYGR